MRLIRAFRSGFIAAIAGAVMATFPALTGAQPADSTQNREQMEEDDDPSKSRAAFPRVSDDEETIYAVQRKAYLVKNKWELTPMFGLSFNDGFVDTLAPGGSLTYHVAENFGIELYGAVMVPNESSLTEEIRLEFGFIPPEAELTQMLWTAGVGVQWSPIYGKVQIFDTYLGNFAFYIGAGIGTGQTRVRCTPRDQLDPNRGFSPPECPAQTDGSATELREVYEPATFKVMGSISGGIRFNFSNHIGLKIEIKDHIFTSRVFRPEETQPSRRFSDAIRNNVFAQIGISILLGGEDG